MYDIYSNNKDDSWRYTLGKSGSRTLLTIGLNPSTATKEKSDTTVAKVEGAASRNGFDGFVMLNLYPVRSTNYNALPVAIDVAAYNENLDQIESLIASGKNSVIWAAWGDSIFARTYFVESAKQLIVRLEKHNVSWCHFGSLTGAGQPRHPSRLSYDWSFSPLDLGALAKTLGT
ncbi:MAG: DUF1643 domain-containing protein [Desulfobulbaceae bacterium]|nr:DUF1643 domain-containing protein [Desulfobulbaceae bacterium]